MKREIEFRGKTAKGEWVYGLLDYFGKDKYCIRTYDEKRNGGVGYQVDENTISQFTGVTDKNGKKIFEGDVVKTKQGKNVNICFEDGAFCFNDDNRYIYALGDSEFCYVYKATTDELEVIGTIFDKESDNGD